MISFLLSLCGVAVQVCLGAAIIAKPYKNDAMQSRIGLAVASPIEPVPVGLAGGGRYGAHSAQRGEGGL